MQKVATGVMLFIIAVTLYTLVDIISSYSSKKDFNETASAYGLTHGLEGALQNNALNAKEKKEYFIQSILPAVRKVKKELDREYAKAKRLAAAAKRTPEEDAWLREKMQQYKVNGIPCLLRRMHTHPVSLVIAQAALETGWGSSRFYNEANNIFGIWSYHTDEPRIPAAQNRGETTIYVKKFETLSDAIRGYFTMISGGYAYGAFRQARMQTDNPFELLRYLRHYSELRDEYVARLYYVIKTNKLYQYDEPAYKPVALSMIIPEYVAHKREAAERRREQEQQMLALDEVKGDDAQADNESVVSCEEEESNVTLQPPLLSKASS